MTDTAATFPCPRCGNILAYGQLACPHCNSLVYAQQLNQLAAEAQQAEQTSLIRAVMIWKQALPLLPPESEQYRMVNDRIGALAAGLAHLPDAGVAPEEPRIVRPPDPPAIAIAKTGGSMLLSIVLYAWYFSSANGWLFGLKFATGFVVLILIHELGHVLAMRYYGLSASPPIFIPFLGALINLRQPPRNALEESVVGIGGPVTGTLAACVVFLIYQQTGSPLMLRLAYFGFMLNLFNMLPMPPLDGGRITAAVSPWIWLSGLGVAVLWILKDYFVDGYFNGVLVLLLAFAWPRIRQTLASRARGGSYYQIGTLARWAMGVSYLALGIVLLTLYVICELHMVPG